MGAVLGALGSAVGTWIVEAATTAAASSAAAAGVVSEVIIEAALEANLIAFAGFIPEAVEMTGFVLNPGFSGPAIVGGAAGGFAAGYEFTTLGYIVLGIIGTGVAAGIGGGIAASNHHTGHSELPTPFINSLLYDNPNSLCSFWDLINDGGNSGKCRQLHKRNKGFGHVRFQNWSEGDESMLPTTSTGVLSVKQNRLNMARKKSKSTKSRKMAVQDERLWSKNSK